MLSLGFPCGENFVAVNRASVEANFLSPCCCHRHVCTVCARGLSNITNSNKHRTIGGRERVRERGREGGREGERRGEREVHVCNGCWQRASYVLTVHSYNVVMLECKDPRTLVLGVILKAFLCSTSYTTVDLRRRSIFPRIIVLERISGPPPPLHPASYCNPAHRMPRAHRPKSPFYLFGWLSPHHKRMCPFSMEAPPLKEGGGHEENDSDPASCFVFVLDKSSPITELPQEDTRRNSIWSLEEEKACLCSPWEHTVYFSAAYRRFNQGFSPSPLTTVSAYNRQPLPWTMITPRGHQQAQAQENTTMPLL